MPTLFQFLMTLAILAGLGYGAMVALVLYVRPTQTEMDYRIPADRINRKPPPVPPAASSPEATSPDASAPADMAPDTSLSTGSQTGSR